MVPIAGLNQSWNQNRNTFSKILPFYNCLKIIPEILSYNLLSISHLYICWNEHRRVLSVWNCVIMSLQILEFCTRCSFSELVYLRRFKFIFSLPTRWTHFMKCQICLPAFHLLSSNTFHITLSCCLFLCLYGCQF